VDYYYLPGALTKPEVMVAVVGVYDHYPAAPLLLLHHEMTPPDAASRGVDGS